MPSKKKKTPEPEQIKPDSEHRSGNGLLEMRRKSMKNKTDCWTVRATGDPWPKSSKVACWWCCHTFDTVPVPLPIRYDDRRDHFFVTGTFCSWSCAKAYNWSWNLTYAPSRSELLFLLRKRTIGTMEPIRPAPHWSKLEMFGGTMSIEDFRQGVNTRPLPLNVFNTNHDHGVVELNKNESATILMPSSVYTALSSSATPASKPAKRLNFDDISTNKNEPLRLRRNKPLPGQNSNILEKILGIGGSKASTSE